MDAEIIYEFERNHVYGSLGRALEGLRQNSHGMLAEKRAQVIPPMSNDGFFYRQVIIAHNCLGALQEFCEDRCRGVEYYEARHKLMDVFKSFMDKPFSDEDYAFFLPSYMDPLPDKTDAEREQAYRYRHLDEFRTTVHALDTFLHQGRANSWSTDIVFGQIESRLDSFMDQDVAAQGFDKFPVPQEIEYFAQAVKWLKERAAQAAAKANVNLLIDTTGMPGMFGRVAGNSFEDKIKYAHYHQSCENLGASLAGVIGSSEYLKMLRIACPSVRVGNKDTVGSFTSHVSVNLPQALAEFSSAYLGHFIDHLPDGQPADYYRDAVEGADSAVADFMDEFIFAPKHQPAPAPSAWKWQELKI